MEDLKRFTRVERIKGAPHQIGRTGRVVFKGCEGPDRVGPKPPGASHLALPTRAADRGSGGGLTWLESPGGVALSMRWDPTDEE